MKPPAIAAASPAHRRTRWTALRGAPGRRLDWESALPGSRRTRRLPLRPNKRVTKGPVPWGRRSRSIRRPLYAAASGGAKFHARLLTIVLRDGPARSRMRLRGDLVEAWVDHLAQEASPVGNVALAQLVDECPAVVVDAGEAFDTM